MRFYSDINSVTLDLAIDSHLQPNIFKHLDTVSLSGILRLTFKNLAPNNPKLFGQVQISLIHQSWTTLNFKFNGVYQLFNFLNPALNILVYLIGCRNYSYTLNNPYAPQSILEERRWTTKPVDRVVIINIQSTSNEHSVRISQFFLSDLIFREKLHFFIISF